MAGIHLIRFGTMGQTGRFRSVDSASYPRRSRVIVRTGRGLEIGEVLVPAHEGFGSEDLASGSSGDGTILRGMTAEDELLAARIEKHRDEAFESCVRLLSEKGLPVTLVEVEHLFDGQGLHFYFLGEVTAELEACMDLLAEAYEAKAQFRQFTQTLLEGCGVDCGTEAAATRSCDGCVVCEMVSVCGASKE